MGFFQEIFECWAYVLIDMFAGIYSSMAKSVFHIEDMINFGITGAFISKLYTIVCGFAIGLVIAKALKKGFWTYILWRDGDPDAPVQHTVINIMLAVGIAVSFPTLYGRFAEVCVWLTSRITEATMVLIMLDGEDSLQVGLEKILNFLLISGIGYILLVIIFIILMIILYITFVKRSAELLALRIGFSLACTGLLDSDNGVFASTVKIFLQVALTTICQLFFIDLSLATFIASVDMFGQINIFFSIGFCIAAFSMPRMLQNIMLATGGGGGLQKVTSTMYTASLIKSFIRR